MNLTEITKRAGSERTKRRVGRGRASGKGKTSGRGHKGYGSRAGSGTRGMAEGGQMPMFRRIPKRGFTNALFRKTYSVVNLCALEERFEAGAHVTAQALLECGLIRSLRHPVKVLGNGTLTKKLVIDAAKFSKSAQEKIQAVGGEARVV